MTRITNRTGARLVAALAILTSHSATHCPGAILLQDKFLYASGPLVGATGSPWSHHSGAEAEIQTNGESIRLSRSQSEDVNAAFSTGAIEATNANVLYVAMDIVVTAPPSPGGSYFTHFNIGGHRARVFVVGSTNDDAFHLAISNASSDTEERVEWPNALQLNESYRILLAYNVSTAGTQLWVNPTSRDSEHIAAVDLAEPTSIRAFALRQAPGMGEILCDNLVVADTFLEASDPGPDIINPTIDIERPTVVESDSAPTRVHLRGLDSQLLPESPILRFTGSASLSSDVRIDLDSATPGGPQLSAVSESNAETRLRIDGLEGHSEWTLTLTAIDDDLPESTEALSIEMERLNLGPTSASVLILRDDDHANVLLDEPFEYGPQPLIETQSGWASHSGSAPGELRVGTGKLVLSRSQSEDVSWEFPDGAKGDVLYAELSLMFGEAPSASGAYFAHWNTSRHHGRLFAYRSDDDGIHLGIANGSSSASEATIWETPIEIGTPVEMVIGYDQESQQSTLWVNADPTIDPGLTATDPSNGSEPTHFSFRQASGIGEIQIESLRILNALDEDISENPTPKDPPTLRLVTGTEGLELKLMGSESAMIESSNDLKTWSPLRTVQPAELPWSQTFPLSTLESPTYFRTTSIADE